MRKIAMWIINNIPVGFLAPYLFGFAIGAPMRKRSVNKETSNG